MTLFNASGVAGAGGGAGHAVWPRMIGVSAYADGNTPSATPTISSPVAGDVILTWCHLVSGGDGVFAAAPTGEGWTRVVDVEDTAGSNSASSLFWKFWGVSGNTDDTTPTFTAAAGSLAAVTETWRDCRQALPIHGSATTHGTSGTTHTCADFSSTASERISVSCFMGGLTAAGNISTMNGTNYVQTAAGSSYATTAGSDRAVALARDEDIVVAGSVGANGVTATFTVTTTAYSTITVVLRGPYSCNRFSIPSSVVHASRSLWADSPGRDQPWSWATFTPGALL